MERVAVVNEDRIHPWTDFLRARQRAILWMVEQGRTFEYIAETLSYQR